MSYAEAFYAPVRGRAALSALSLVLSTLLSPALLCAQEPIQEPVAPATPQAPPQVELPKERLALSELRFLTPTAEEVKGEPPLLSDVLKARSIEQDQEECKARSGRWRTLNEKLHGCVVKGGREGRWTMTSEAGEIKVIAHFKGDKLEGPYLEFYDSGRASREGAWAQGEQEGRWRHWHTGGQLALVAYFKQGKRHGRSFSWYESCLPHEWGAYQEGEPEGPWRVWHVTGARAEEGVYEGGVKQGEWAFYHVEGNKLEQGVMLNGLREGAWREWLHTGTFWREVTYAQGQRQGTDEEACEAAGGVWEVDYKERVDRCARDGAPIIVERHYDESGALRRRVPYTLDGENQGTEQRFHPTGELLAEFEVLRGVPEGVYSFKSPTGEVYGEHVITQGTGPWRSYHPNGALEEEGRYEQGVKVGRWRTFYDHAQPQGLSPAGEGEAERPVGLKDELTFSDQGAPEGPYLSLYEDGTLSVTGAFSGGSRAGAWRFHYQNGQVAIEAHYNMGMRSGPWSEWHWLASPKVKGQHLINRKDGVWEEYHNNGKLKARGRYLKGKKEGAWELFWYSGEPWRTVMYEGGVMREEEPLACEMISGTWSEDLEARRAGCNICRVSAEGAPKQLKVGRWRWWHPNGALEGEGDYEGGEPHGLWRQFDEEGRLTLEGRYEHGERVELWRGFFSSGALQYEGRFEPIVEVEPPQQAPQEAQEPQEPQEEPSKGREEGVWYTFHPSGSLESAGRYEGGRRVGVWAWWHEGGALSQVGAYQEGEREGVWVSWHPEGSLRDIGAYVKGERRGVWRWWRATGEAWRAQWYGEGRARLSLPEPRALSVLGEVDSEGVKALEALKDAVNASLPQRSAEALKSIKTLKKRPAPQWSTPPRLPVVSERVKGLLRSSGLEEEPQPSSPSERVR